MVPIAALVVAVLAASCTVRKRSQDSPASHSAWSEMSKGFEKAWKAMSSGFERVWSEFHKDNGRSE